MRWRGQSASLGGIFCAATSRLKHPTFLIVPIHLVNELKTPTPKNFITEMKNSNCGDLWVSPLEQNRPWRLAASQVIFSDKKKKDWTALAGFQLWARCIKHDSALPVLQFALNMKLLYQVAGWARTVHLPRSRANTGFWVQSGKKNLTAIPISNKLRPVSLKHVNSWQ